MEGVGATTVGVALLTEVAEENTLIGGEQNIH